MNGFDVEPQRIVELNGAPEGNGDYVLYWMQQSQRADFNPALEVAISEANRLSLPVVVGFGLTDAYPGANARHYAFMLEGLAETAPALEARGLRFAARRGAPDDVAIRLAVRSALVICDRGYLRVQKAWRERVARSVGRRMLQVEGDVIVPVDLVSRKQEIGARTLRPKLARWRDEFLRPLRPQAPAVRADNIPIHSDIDLSDRSRLLASLRIDANVAPVAGFKGGYREARRRLDAFVASSIHRYAAARALPGEARVSGLSPYLHFGQISPVEIALAVRNSEAADENRVSYLDELIIRRELAINFVHTAAGYDRYESLPEWARDSLARHRHDDRTHVYGYDDFARAATHDPYWNAAMCEMLATGYMHNHMRMYWGKKVLEWTASPEEGYATLQRLNDTFFLDGRDASSYANVGWVFGLHDRPWPERPVFGKVRYMNAAGLERKTDIDAYVAKIARLTESDPGRR